MVMKNPLFWDIRDLWTVEIQSTFQKHMSPQTTVSKNKPSKQPVSTEYTALYQKIELFTTVTVVLTEQVGRLKWPDIAHLYTVSDHDAA
jgi:hypothetical protein